MKREPVKSSSIKSVGYEDHSKILKIEFSAAVSTNTSASHGGYISN